MIDTPFCIEDAYFSDLESFIEDCSDSHETDLDWVLSLPDTWTQEVEPCTSEKMFQLDEDDIERWMQDMVDMHEDRVGEVDQTEELKKAFVSGVDLAKINAAIPELWYPNGTKYTITKQDLLDVWSAPNAK